MMENPNAQNSTTQPVAPDGNSFVTTDLPDPEMERQFLARKRIFFVMLGLAALFTGLIIWEIVDLIL